MSSRAMKTILQQVLMYSVLISFLLAGCSSGDTPEQQVGKFIDAGEEAVESRDIGDVRALISEKYEDERGRTRQDIVAYTARYLYANKNIHLLTRIGEMTFPSEDRALVQLFVAMTGQNVSDLDALLNMQADLYRFDLELIREDGEWKLRTADWRQAESGDFF